MAEALVSNAGNSDADQISASVDSEQQSNSESDETTCAIRTKMLAKVSLSDAHFKHQQRGEPDLTLDEKIETCQNLLDTNKVKFLEKFWTFLDMNDVKYFDKFRSEYEVDFYVKQIMKNNNVGFQKNRVKNRRYRALQELISNGEYFSDDEMKFREPFLYEQMVGQYMTDDEIQAKVDKTDLKFSSILLKHIDQLDENARYGADKDKEESQVEEEEDDGDEEEEEEEMEVTSEKLNECDEGNETISTEQKEELKAEFLTIMQEKFLNGEDKAFDYKSVDYNDVYDDLDLLNADAEEKYFDDDDDDT
ncbi:Coiled-coil domain-containing protein 97 [Mactra antiquata]